MLVAATVAAVVVASVALAQRPTALAKIVVVWSGASPQEVDQVVSHPLLTSLSDQQVTVTEVSSISGEGECTIYLRSGAGVSGAQLLAAIRQAVENTLPQLPADADPPRVSLLPSGAGIPVVKVEQVARARVVFDRQRLDELGISLSDAARLLETALGDDSGKGRETVSPDIVLTHRQGVAVKLSDVAAIHTDRTPNYVIRRAKSAHRKAQTPRN
ncbi:MAG: efflux RND transporter permease subunit [Pirellulaceae bacterium]|nr:efflux RND transporter permease subunit [Pirellulaceae bacterium]